MAAQTQTRLNASEKLDTAQASLRLRTAVSELASKNLKQRVLSDLEARIDSLLTLLQVLTIYQYMVKILGVDKTPVCSINSLRHCNTDYIRFE